MKTIHILDSHLARVGVAVTLLYCPLHSLRAEDQVTLQLEKSTDMTDWEPVEISTGMLDAQGRIVIDGAPGSEFYRLRIEPVVPGGFALVPAGSYSMGDSFPTDWPIDNGPNPALPVHTVTLSAFYMEKTEVSKALWDEVATWAENNGYDISASSASGKAPDHPVYDVTWYECLKWCNARSQKEGLTPCYTIGGEVYKSADSAADCDFSASGYRLPTEAEWEMAARGALSGNRFPWGDTIDHDLSNYYSDSEYSYDVSATRGFHPTYSGGTQPFTSPVGSFTANGLGIYNMAGNVAEWCSDWHSWTYYSISPENDPHGPAAGSDRVTRGGGGHSIASLCRVASRSEGNPPGLSNINLGFRSARTVVP